MARPNAYSDEDEPAMMQEAINHPTRGKQWEKAIQDEYDIMISESVIKHSLQKTHWSRKVVCFLILNKNHCIDDLTNCSLKNGQQRDVKSLGMHD